MTTTATIDATEMIAIFAIDRVFRGGCSSPGDMELFWRLESVCVVDGDAVGEVYDVENVVVKSQSALMEMASVVASS